MINQSTKIVAIVQARLGSTRLPKKIFLPLSNIPILSHVYNRLNFSKYIHETVIATTDLSEDDLIEDYCKKNKIKFFRGSSDDVLSRYFFAAQKFNADVVVRITSDCPLIDPTIVDNIITEFLKNKVDYASNVLKRTFPRGYDAEVFSFKTLEKAFQLAKKEYEREHVTPFIYNHPEMFNLFNYENEIDYSNYRLTVDTKEDYELLKIIYDSLYSKNKIFLMKDVIEFLKKNPDLVNINKHIEQKKLKE